MMAKPMRTLILCYPVIQFLIINNQYLSHEYYINLTQLHGVILSQSLFYFTSRQAVRHAYKLLCSENVSYSRVAHDAI